MLPLVALVGRPNVGKSTLFNALTRTRDALVHDEPGVTRDRNYGVCRLQEGRPFVLVDTGGIAGEDEGLAGATARQSRAAAEEADVISLRISRTAPLASSWVSKNASRRPASFQRAVGSVAVLRYVNTIKVYLHRRAAAGPCVAGWAGWQLWLTWARPERLTACHLPRHFRCSEE